MLSPFFFRRIDPGICPGLAPGFVSQVLGDGIPGGIPVGHAVVFGESKSPAKNRPINQAAHVAPALRRASGLSRRLLAPPRWSRLRPAQPSALARSGPSRSVLWSATPPGTACAVQWPARSGAPWARAVASQPSSATLPTPESRPSCSDRRGPRCARQATGLASTAAQTTAFAHALRRGGGSACPLAFAALTSRPAAPVAGATYGRVRMARLSRCPRARPGQAGAALRAVTHIPRPDRNASTDAVASPLRLRAALRADADRSGVKRRFLRPPRPGTPPRHVAAAPPT